MNTGTRVIITNGYELSQKYKYGTVIKTYTSEENHSYHGSPHYPEITEVRGDDGRFYTNDTDTLDYCNFYTVEDYLSRIMYKTNSLIVETANKIQDLNELRNKISAENEPSEIEE